MKSNYYRLRSRLARTEASTMFFVGWFAALATSMDKWWLALLCLLAVPILLFTSNAERRSVITWRSWQDRAAFNSAFTLGQHGYTPQTVRVSTPLRIDI